MEILIYIALALVGGLFVVAFAVGMNDAVNRARAWRLWEADLIDDTELRRRIGY